MALFRRALLVQMPPVRGGVVGLVARARSFSTAAATTPVPPPPPPALEGSMPTGNDLIYQFDKKTGVAILTFNRPQTLNAMTVEMGNQFESTITYLSRNHFTLGVRALVVTGAGKAFSAGGDLDYLLARSIDSPASNYVQMERFYRRYLSIRSLPVPTLSAIHGSAIGAGLAISLATDIRVCTPTANLGVTFAKLGLHPGMGCTYFLPQVVGNAMASRMLLTGETISGQRAKEIGLVSELSSGDTAESVLQAAKVIAESIAANPPVATSLTTRTIRLRDGVDAELARALRNEANGQALSYAEPDFRVRILAMKEKASKKSKSA